MNNGSWRDYITHKRYQTCAGSIGYVTHSYTPKALFWFYDFYCYYHNAFNSTAASFAALLDATDKGFVYFNISGKRFTLCIYHGNAKTLEHSPCKAIIRSERTLQCFC